jgi:small GTP-binding protein
MLLSRPPAALVTVRVRIDGAREGEAPAEPADVRCEGVESRIRIGSMGASPSRVAESLAAWIDKRLSKPLIPGRVTHSELRDDSGVIDDPVAVLHEDGRTVDLTLHGGAWVVEATLDLLRRDGFDVIEFDPFDARCIAMCDGGTDDERKTNALLALARTELAVESVMRRGEIPNLQSAIRNLLLPPTIAIVGPPNAGKSTLANALFGQQRSIVSPVPGTTRDWVGEEADLLGLIVKLIDTPGVRSTHDAIEREAIDLSADAKREADCVLILLDGSEPVAAQSLLRERLQHQFADRSIVVLNKADAALPEWEHQRIDHRVSATTGAGLEALVRAVRSRFVPWADEWDASIRA